MASRTISFSKEAELEFHRAKCYMDIIHKFDEFWEDAESQVEFIRKFPEAFQIRYKNIRIVALEHFNYSIHYAIEKDRITIYRFLQQSQDF